MNPEEEPSLLREIAKVAWSMLKYLLAAAVVVSAFLPLANHHPVLATYLLCAVLLASMVVQVGWQTWKDKKRDLARRREYEQRFSAEGRS